MRVAIYARVSTDDSKKGEHGDKQQRQDPENQLMVLREWCKNSGHKIVGEYVDRESGRKGTDKRQRFAELFADASMRKFDLVMFWALDRFSREGLYKTINHLQRLDSYGVAFHSYQEPHLNTDNKMVRDILLSILAILAEHEAKRISERVHVGLKKALKDGKTLGRPRLEKDEEQIHRAREARRMLANGDGILKVAKALKMGSHAVHRIKRQMQTQAVIVR